MGFVENTSGQPFTGRLQSYASNLRQCCLSDCLLGVAKRVTGIVIVIFNRVIVPIFRCLKGIVVDLPMSCINRFRSSVSFTALPGYLRQQQQKVDNEVIREYRNANPQIDDIDLLRRRLVFIQAQFDNCGLSLDLARDLFLSEQDRVICDTIVEISQEVHRLRGFYPRMNQLLSVMLFLEGKRTALAQIRTGQGKTLIAAMTAIARKKLYDENICILTTTEPLAISGVSEMRSLYEAFGITVGCFDGRGFVGDSRPAASGYDVIYTTSYGLECDKNAKKKNGRNKLDIWETPVEILERLLRYRECRQFQAASRQLLDVYKAMPSKENEQRIKDQIQLMKSQHPGLGRMFKELCLIVDECDSVLYDHVSHSVHTTEELPYHDQIKEVGITIAEEAKRFYGGVPSPSEGDIERFRDILKERIVGQFRVGTFLGEYIRGEVDQWIADAIMVMDPNSSEWQDGVRYLRAPSMAYDLNSMFVKLADLYKDLSVPVQTQLQAILREGLDLNDILARGIPRDSTQVAGYADALSRYMPRLLVALTQENVQGELSRSFKDSFVELYVKVQQMKTANRSQLQAVLFHDQIRFVEAGTAQIINNMKFQNLIHMFLEYKEYGKIITLPTTSLDTQSQLDVIRNAHCVIGFTGTLPDESSHYAEYIHFKKLIERAYTRDARAVMKNVPDFTNSKMKHERTINCRNKTEWHRHIIGKIRQKRRNQGILLICKNPREAQDMRDFLISQSDPNYRPRALYIRKEDEAVINDSYSAGDIVITTALGSRGTDWHVTAPKGFHVLCTYKPHDLRTKIQISGRGARSGQEGSYGEIIIQSDEQVRDGLRLLDNRLLSTCYSDLFTSIYRIFQGVVPKEKKKQLVLWMSMKQTRSDIFDAIAKSLQNDTSALEDILTRFCRQFDVNSQRIKESFYHEVLKWHADTTAVLAR